MQLLASTLPWRSCRLGLCQERKPTQQSHRQLLLPGLVVQPSTRRLAAEHQFTYMWGATKVCKAEACPRAAKVCKSVMSCCVYHSKPSLCLAEGSTDRCFICSTMHTGCFAWLTFDYSVSRAAISPAITTLMGFWSLVASAARLAASCTCSGLVFDP